MERVVGRLARLRTYVVHWRQGDRRLLDGSAVVCASVHGPTARLRRECQRGRNFEVLDEVLLADRHADEHLVEPADRVVRHQTDLPDRELRLRNALQERSTVDLQRCGTVAVVELDIDPLIPPVAIADLRVLPHHAIDHSPHARPGPGVEDDLVIVLCILVAVDEADTLRYLRSAVEHTRANDVVRLSQLCI